MQSCLPVRTLLKLGNAWGQSSWDHLSLQTHSCDTMVCVQIYLGNTFSTLVKISSPFGFIFCKTRDINTLSSIKSPNNKCCIGTRCWCIFS